MKNWIVPLLLGVALGLSQTAAADAVSDMKAPAKWAPAKRTMAKNGRFHYLHVKKEKMECGDCHSDQSKDRLFVRATESPPATLGAHVDRAECVECHQGDKKPAWYAAKPK